MSTQLDEQPPPVTIPDPDAVRRRLESVLTEAALLRSQWRVSARLEREHARRQAKEGGRS
jgi:hypothetical protein